MIQISLRLGNWSVAGLILIIVWLIAVPGMSEPAGSIMDGTPHKTAYYASKGDEPGPVILIIGGCHGDETAGYLAADKIAKWRATRGTLVTIPRAHVTTIARNTRGYPGNRNRMFPGKPDGTMMEQLAYAQWALIKQWHPAFLLTLHESWGYHATNRESFGQTLTYDFDSLTADFQSAINDANKLIQNKAHHFRTYVYPVKTCPTYCAMSFRGGGNCA